MHKGSYIMDCLSGICQPNDIDQYVDDWHNKETGCTLREFLGFTHEECEAWGRGTVTIAEILSNHQKTLYVRMHGKETIQTWRVPKICSLSEAIKRVQTCMGRNAVKLDTDNCDFGTGAYALIQVGNTAEDTVLYGISNDVVELADLRIVLEQLYPEVVFRVIENIGV